MKILTIFYHYPLYPQGSYFQEFLNKLAESVDKVYLLACHYPKTDFKKHKNIKIFWVPLVKINYIGEVFFMIAVLLKAIFDNELRQADVVNSIGPRGLLAGWYLRKVYQIPLVCTIEALNEKGSLFRNIYYGLVRLLVVHVPVDKFICWSNYFWEDHLKKWGIPEDKVVIIPGGIDTEINNPQIDGGEIKKKYAPDSPLIVFAKPLHDYNTGPAELIVQSIALLRPELEVKALIGSGDGKNRVQYLAQKLGALDLVSFMPPTPFPEIPKYIAAADLVVLPYTSARSTSRSLLEAMAIGKPIITTSVGETGRILKNKEHAIIVEAKPEFIAPKIKLLLKNKQLSKEIRAGALKLIKNKFSLSIVIDQTLAIFEDLTAS